MTDAVELDNTQIEDSIQESTVPTAPAEDLNSTKPEPFDLDAPFVFNVEKKTPKGIVNISHTLRRPAFKELAARDDAQPYRSRDIGGDKEEPILDLNNKADAKLYDGIVTETKGYAPNVTPGQTADERAAALRDIPSSHKAEIIRAIVATNSTVKFDTDVEIESFNWGEDLDYTVETEIGAAAQFKVISILRDPSEKQLSDYRAAATHFVIEKGQRKPVTTVSINLAPAVELYNALVKSVDGVVVGGAEFDVNNSAHIAKLDAYMKRSAIDALIKSVQLDLGN